jgi:hypothetical protein
MCSLPQSSPKSTSEALWLCQDGQWTEDEADGENVTISLLCCIFGAFLGCERSNERMAQVSSMAPIAVTVVPME